LSSIRSKSKQEHEKYCKEKTSELPHDFCYFLVIINTCSISKAENDNHHIESSQAPFYFTPVAHEYLITFPRDISHDEQLPRSREIL